MKIVICSASRSERALQQPLIDKLAECHVLQLPVDFKKAFEVVELFLKEHGKPDLAFCSFDRPEMLGAAQAFFFNNVKVAQYHAGDHSGDGESFDDVARHLITLVSTYQFCNGQESFLRCCNLLRSVGKPIENCYDVGSMALDGVELDYSVVPGEPFDLVVYNPPNNSTNAIAPELVEIMNLIDKKTLWVHPNEDPGRNVVIQCVKNLSSKGVVEVETLPRPQFLALLKKADRVIGNSSSFFVELPLFGKRHIHIGVRNKSRGSVSIDTHVGASSKIFKIVSDDYENRK